MSSPGLPAQRPNFPASPIRIDRKAAGDAQMTRTRQFSRRALLMKIGICLQRRRRRDSRRPDRPLSSVSGGARAKGYDVVVSLGPVGTVSRRRDAPRDLPQSRRAATDGETADIACWVRHVDGQTFPGVRHQLRASRLPRALVPAIEPVSCARATAAPTTKTARAPPARPSADCSNTITRSKTASS